MTAPIQPLDGVFHDAVIHHQAGRLAEAEGLYRRILGQDPNQPDANHNLGVIAVQVGRATDGLPHLARALEAVPEHRQYRLSLADALVQAARPAEALWTLEQGPVEASPAAEVAARARAAMAEAERLFAQAVAEHLGGAKDAAFQSYGRVLAVNAAHPEAHCNLGLLWADAGRWEEARLRQERAIALNPAIADFHAGLGLALYRLGRLEESEASLRQAIALDPAHAKACNNLGAVLLEAGRAAESEEWCRRALGIKPDFAEALYNLGNALREMGRRAECLDSYRRALELSPGFADAHVNMAAVLAALGQVEEAMGHLEAAVALRPDHIDAHRGLLATIIGHPGLDHETLFAHHRRFEAVHARPLYGGIAPHGNDRDPDRRLRIGYLSSDFRSHSVARNLLPILKAHDRAKVEVFCYAEIAKPDAVTQEIQGLADGWRSIHGLSDQEAAALIREDRIDILVCLAGRFDRNRPLICAFKPAPVQISYHDVATSGMEVMDYLISDRVLTPRGTKERFTERPLCLPSFYIGAVPADLPPPRRRGGAFMFGCFNNPSKINEAVLDLWADLLASLPDSRLTLKYLGLYDDPLVRRRLTDRLGPDRVVFPAEVMAGGKHLDLYNDIDLALDPFPFSGSTTTFEALCMGVPVLALRGTTMVGAWSASMLRVLGLDDFIAKTPADYLEIARNWAARPDELRTMRAGVRDRVSASPLCDPVRRARQIERLYRAAWRRYVAETSGMNPSA